jgi:hypothetical protein
MAMLETLPRPLAAFLREARCIDNGACVAPMAQALAAVDDEANEVEDAASLITALTRVAAMPWPFMRRLTAMSDILGQRGRVTVTFTRDDMRIETRPS